MVLAFGSLVPTLLFFFRNYFKREEALPVEQTVAHDLIRSIWKELLALHEAHSVVLPAEYSSLLHETMAQMFRSVGEAILGGGVGRARPVTLPEPESEKDEVCALIRQSRWFTTLFYLASPRERPPRTFSLLFSHLIPPPLLFPWVHPPGAQGSRARGTPRAGAC